MTLTPDVVEAAPESTWVVTPEALRLAVRRLINRRTYPFFPGYVYLRQQAAESGTTQRISADWRGFGREVLEVPGAPDKKPHLKPFQEKAGRADGYQWWYSNIAGSWSHASLRAGKSALEVISLNEDDGTYNLRPGHPGLALDHLLYGERMCALDLATFFLRDYGLVSAEPPRPEDLIANFRLRYGVIEDDEFNTVYDAGVQTEGLNWFEYLGPASEREGE